nr:hypothetical protein [Rhizobium sp. SL42]
MRGLLRNFGLNVGQASGGTFDGRIRELVEHDAELTEIMEPLLAGRRKLREGLAKLEKRVLAEAKQDEVCRRLMTVRAHHVDPANAHKILLSAHRLNNYVVRPISRRAGRRLHAEALGWLHVLPR